MSHRQQAENTNFSFQWLEEEPKTFFHCSIAVSCEAVHIVPISYLNFSLTAAVLNSSQRGRYLPQAWTDSQKHRVAWRMPSAPGQVGPQAPLHAGRLLRVHGGRLLRVRGAATRQSPVPSPGTPCATEEEGGTRPLKNVLAVEVPGLDPPNVQVSRFGPPKG